MPSSSILEQVLTQVSNFLNQNDLVALATTCRGIAERVAIPKLYDNIIITKDVPLRSDNWYLDGGVTYLSGYRSTVKTEDQADIYLYDRLERLCESQYLNSVKKLTIQQNVFYDQTSGSGKLQALLDKIFSLDNVEWLDIQDKSLLLKNYSSLLSLSHSKFLRIYNLDDLKVLNKDCIAALRSLELILDSKSLSDNSLAQIIKSTILPQLEELSIKDIECSSLRAFQYLCDEGVILENLRFLKLNHVHSINNHKRELSELTPTYISEVVPFEKIKRLELEFSCELDICDCADTFLSSLSVSLVSLTELGLIEHNFLNSWKHDTAENWDLTIGKFILGLPQVGENMKKLSIRHHLPVNGIITDGVEGNYNRRRELYQHILPKLKSLKTLVAPTFLQSISAYEVLVCDLLWNGCQCDYCKKVLDIYDDYILNHQYLCDKTGVYKDVIPTVFFAYSGDAFARRLMSIDSWDTTRLHWAPVQYLWNMHGYNNLMHFNDYECLFDESAFRSLGKCVTHFFNTYMDHLVKYMPNLRTCVLSGIYYQCHRGGTYESLFD